MVNWKCLLLVQTYIEKNYFICERKRNKKKWVNFNFLEHLKTTFQSSMNTAAIHAFEEKACLTENRGRPRNW